MHASFVVVLSVISGGVWCGQYRREQAPQLERRAVSLLPRLRESILLGSIHHGRLTTSDRCCGGIGFISCDLIRCCVLCVVRQSAGATTKPVFFFFSVNLLYKQNNNKKNAPYRNQLGPTARAAPAAAAAIATGCGAVLFPALPPRSFPRPSPSGSSEPGGRSSNSAEADALEADARP